MLLLSPAWEGVTTPHAGEAPVTNPARGRKKGTMALTKARHTINDDRLGLRHRYDGFKRFSKFSSHRVNRLDGKKEIGRSVLSHEEQTAPIYDPRVRGGIRISLDQMYEERAAMEAEERQEYFCECSLCRPDPVVDDSDYIPDWMDDDFSGY